MKFNLFISGLLLGGSALTASSVELPDSVYHYEASAQAVVSTGEQTPFWLVNNRKGLSSIDKSNGYVRAGFFKEFQYDRRFSWEAGVDLVVPWNYTSKFVVQQLYAGIRYRSLSFMIGQKEWENGVTDPELSSGDMFISQNARPVPQGRLEMKEFQKVPFTKSWLAVRGYISFGMFDDWRWERSWTGGHNKWAEHVLYHTKGGFLRIGNEEKLPVTLDAGLEMGCQFGGTLHRADGEIIKFPAGLKGFWKALFPQGGGDSDDPNQSGDISNIYGNQLGQWSFALNYDDKNVPWKARLYYEHFFEDHSQMFFDHAWKDMLLGLQVTPPKNPVVSEFVYEYIVTKDQSGSVYWDKTPEIPDQISGTDNYYNHNYPGWQNWGMGIGNPLLISPIYNKDHILQFFHNRIKGHHFGWKGNPTDEIDYRVLLTLTRSWGTYGRPTDNILHNFNGLLEVGYRPHQLPGWQLRVAIAGDAGKLLGKSFGAMFTISKSGWL